MQLTAKISLSYFFAFDLEINSLYLYLYFINHT